MKRNVVLLIDADAEGCAATLEAARTAGLDVRYEQTARGLSEVSEYGTTMLKALDPCPAIILISGFEGTRFHPVALRQGAVGYLGIPVSIERLEAAIEKFAQTPGTHRCHCDAWGHLCEGCDRSRRKPEKAYALFAEELLTGINK